jgi:FtsH-binding integral membrane protein
MPRELSFELEQSNAKLLTRFFHQVYLWMAVGLVLTACVSFGIANFAPGLMIGSPMVAVVAALALFAIGWATQKAALQISAAAGIGLFLLYATVMGVLMSFVWVAYEMATIGSAFLLTGGVFGITTIIGFVTKINLSKIGPILGMCALGLFGASIINVFFASDTLSWVITYAVVVIFTGLMIYYTQTLKVFAIQNAGNEEMAGRVAIVGALMLYVAFINLFLAILRILGSRR